MKINRIELCNFGSYAGVCVFDLLSERRKGNIVLIGGKNGAGKTTLYSGIKLCLYGNRAEGFESINSFYRKEVRKYINDVSKFESAAKCYVKVTAMFANGQNEDEYEMLRMWNNSAVLLEDFEEFQITKNGIRLSEEKMADFENYVMNIIPPELFDLFFFDGEQIADYFLCEDGNERVKNAFMILCGYDTFDIMQKNFKRLTYGKKNTDTEVELNYVEAKRIAEETEKELLEARENLELIRASLDTVNLEVKTFDRKYKLSGGVTFAEWNEKLLQIKEEERMREEKNTLLKKMANEVIPFIIVRSLLKREERKFDEESKNNSIMNLSERSVAFLDELQKRLYKNEIKKVEELFMKKIKELARKNRFIDRIMIDSDFNVHIYKNITFSTRSVCNRILKIGIPAYISEYGTIHCQGLLSSSGAKDLADFIRMYADRAEKITVLQEIEKSRLSKGEKQVFIMALYWSFMQLNKQEVPFVIDTPFARIDSEHRTNITKRFFMDLSGQVFIFSTNEEIVGEHYEQMCKKIQAKFLLENVDNLQTTVYANEYFGGEICNLD